MMMMAMSSTFGSNGERRERELHYRSFEEEEEEEKISKEKTKSSSTTKITTMGTPREKKQRTSGSPELLSPCRSFEPSSSELLSPFNTDGKERASLGQGSEYDDSPEQKNPAARDMQVMMAMASSFSSGDREQHRSFEEE